MPDLKKMLTLEALSEALPSWLKRSTKPEYNADEIDSTLTTNQFVSASDKDNWNAKGTYSKPSGGIPKSDLSSIVQTSLEKADSALQSETDPTVPSWAKQTNKPSYNADEISSTGTTNQFVTSTEKNTWNSKQNALNFDDTPTQNSDNPVKSGGVYSALAGKVDNVSGKGLSTEDYTTSEKNKLSGIADNANNYVHPTSSGYKHIPSGGSSGKVLGWSADGTAAWVDPTGGGGDVSSIKVGSTPYYPDSSGIVSLPAYPTSLPANGGTASNVSGTVAIANGGTGATSASGARTNLGLGSAATRSYTSSVTSGSTSLVTSGAVYSAIEYLTPSLKSKRYVCSTTDYEQCADVAITVPANKTIQYTANLKFNNAPPRGVQVRTGTDLSNLNQVVGIQETTQNYSNLSVTGLYTNTSSSQVILYIYVKSNSVTSGGNDVVTNVFRLN